MADCPKCSGTLRVRGKYWICSNSPWCGYQREAIRPVLSQAELLEDNKRLREIIVELVKEISHDVHKTAQDVK